MTGGDGMAALVPPQIPMQEKKGRAPKLSVALALPLPDPVEKLVDPMDPPAARDPARPPPVRARGRQAEAGRRHAVSGRGDRVHMP